MTDGTATFRASKGWADINSSDRVDELAEGQLVERWLPAVATRVAHDEALSRLASSLGDHAAQGCSRTRQEQPGPAQSIWAAWLLFADVTTH